MFIFVLPVCIHIIQEKRLPEQPFWPTAANNARKGAAKLSAKVKGRTRLYKDDGSWTWQYPKK
jgi:hypothetical protein